MTTTRPTFLNEVYSAYYHRDIPKEDEELTHVGPSTPCGEYLRRFWHPIALSEELKDLPQAIKIMGEELVVFRDKSGRVGCLELHCSHRGTSLEFGLIEERGIRCCYHGWQFDLDGRILDTPGEPPDSTYKVRLCHGAYPVHEFSGLVFAYMGPPDKQPPFPLYDSWLISGYRLQPVEKNITPCNWLQMVDNFHDPIHTRFLHSIGGPQIGELMAIPAELDWVETPIGIAVLETRRVGDKVWVRLDDCILPNIAQASLTRETADQEKPLILSDLFSWAVPVDDTHTLRTLLIRTPEGEEVPEARREAMRQTQRVRSYEEMQRRPSDYEAQVSQRPIAIHALEHLAETDRGVNMARDLRKQGILAVQRGEDPSSIFREDGKQIPTYSSSMVKRIPPAQTPEEDQKLLRNVGRQWAYDCINTPPAIRTGQRA